MKKLKMIVSIIMTATILLSATPVMAASTGSVANDLSAGEDVVQNARTAYGERRLGTSQTNVYLTVDNDNIVVGVPTAVILSGTPNNNGEYVGDYSVSVAGDMAADETLTVEPESDTVTISQTGKSDVTGSITQSKTEFDCDDLANNTVTTGAVKATGLTAGSWNGSFNMNIQLEGGAQKWYDVTSTIDIANQDYGRVNQYGAFTNTTASKYINIPVEEGERFRISGYCYGSDKIAILRTTLSDDTVVPKTVKAHYPDTSQGGGFFKDVEFTIPENVKWLTISYSTVAAWQSKFKVEKLGNDDIDVLKQYTIDSDETLSWSIPDKYVTISVDDTNNNIDAIAEVFRAHNMPACWGTQYSRLKEPTTSGKIKKDILLEEQARGSEIMVHGYITLGRNSTDADYYASYVTEKERYEAAGFNVYGYLMIGGGDANAQDFAKSTHYAYRAGYLYSDRTSSHNIYNRRYYNPRNWSYETKTADEITAAIEAFANGSGHWLNIGSHCDQSGIDATKMSPEKLDVLLTACEDNNIQVVTWKYLYDNFASTN